MRELEQAQHDLEAAREGTAEQRVPPEATSQRVERILESAQRIADEVETGAKDAAARLLAEASARAAMVVRAAERRAAEIVEEGLSKAADCARQVAQMHNHYAELRGAFELG